MTSHAAQAGPDEVRELLDRHRIHQCLLRYARGVDRLDADLVRSAFWPDARDSHGQMDGSVEEFLATWMPTQGVRDGCQHAIHNHYVEFDAAGPEVGGAHVETYFQVAIHDVGQPTLELVGGRYVDHVTCRAGEWRIQQRVVVLDWQCTADASAM